MSRRQKVILAVLALLLALVWSRVLLSGRPNRPAVLARVSPSAVLPADSTAPAAEVPERWGDSPFLAERGSRGTAVTDASSPKGSYVLNGILWDPKAPSAIINNRVVGVGEHLNGWEVVEIQKDKVILSDGTSTRTLSAS